MPRQPPLATDRRSRLWPFTVWPSRLGPPGRLPSQRGPPAHSAPTAQGPWASAGRVSACQAYALQALAVETLAFRARNFWRPAASVAGFFWNGESRTVMYGENSDSLLNVALSSMPWSCSGRVTGAVTKKRYAGKTDRFSQPLVVFGARYRGASRKSVTFLPPFLEEKGSDRSPLQDHVPL